MSLGLEATILLGGLAVLLFLGIEVFAAVGIMSVVGLVLFANQNLTQLASTAFNTMNSFALTAVPLFIFMGEMLSTTGVIKSLFDVMDKWVGRMPGGIVCSVIGANAVFGALQGSTVVATATFGKVTMPEMERRGYHPRLALGAIASSAVLSAAIPPSFILIVYGGFAQVSVPGLFAATLIPGILLTIMFMLVVVVMVKLNPSLAPTPSRATWHERMIAARNMLPWIAIIIIILGSIFGGFMTPTEAASLGAVISVVLALAYRKFSFHAVKESMRTAVVITAMVAFLLFTSTLMGQVFVHIGLTDLFANLVLSLPFGKFGILAVIAIVYLILGCFISDLAILLLTFPFILPVITHLGFSPIWFGIWYLMVGDAGLITPPFGLNLFTLHAVAPKYDVMTIAWGALPFLVCMIAMGAMLAVWPQLAMWLPGVLY